MVDGWTPQDVANKADHEGGVEELFRWGFRSGMISDEYPEFKHKMSILEALFREYDSFRRYIRLPEPNEWY